MWMRQHKTLVMAAAMGAVSIMLVMVAVLPIYNSARKLASKVKIRSDELESLSTKVSLLSQLDAAVLTERVAVLDSALPPRKDVLLYLNSIDGLSKELGLSFGGLSLKPGELTEEASAAANPKVSKTSGGLQKLETEIKIQGGKESIYTFLRTIEQVLPLMEIENIKVSIMGEDQYSLALSLGMLWAESTAQDVKGAVTLFGEQEDKYFRQLSEYRTFETTIGEVEEVESETLGNMFTPFTEATTPQQ